MKAKLPGYVELKKIPVHTLNRLRTICRDEEIKEQYICLVIKKPVKTGKHETQITIRQNTRAAAENIPACFHTFH